MLLLLLFGVFLIVFIAGMTILRIGLFNLSARTMQSWLTKLTDQAWKGLIIGTVITAILQSSSAVMIIAIGLISARIITFRQSIGIILGTNIGTTVTTEIITLNIDLILVPLVLVGTFLSLWANKNIRSFGFILFGIGAVFISMNGFKYLAEPLMNVSSLETIFILMKDSTLLSVVLGAIVTAIIQSSTALTGIAMGFLNSNAIELKTGIALMLGSNIGTCMTAYLAAVGSGKEARLCAYAHIWLNVIGVALFFPFIESLSNFASQMTLKADVQLAHASVLFNVISSLVVLPFANHFATFILKLHNRT